MNIKTIASAVLAAVVLCAAPAFADGKMNLNTATEQELSANPAVGPELAKGIVEFRENVGDIKSMDELPASDGRRGRQKQQPDRFTPS